MSRCEYHRPWAKYIDSGLDRFCIDNRWRIRNSRPCNKYMICHTCNCASRRFEESDKKWEIIHVIPERYLFRLTCYLEHKPLRIQLYPSSVLYCTLRHQVNVVPRISGTSDETVTTKTNWRARSILFQEVASHVSTLFCLSLDSRIFLRVLWFSSLLRT